MKISNIFRTERDSDGELLFVFFNDFSFFKKTSVYEFIKKLERCFRRLRKICRTPELQVEMPKPKINDALWAVQRSYDEGIGYIYKFSNEDLAKYIYPDAKRDLLVNAKLVYFDKQDKSDKEFIRKNILEILNEDNQYISRITLLYNYIMRIQDDLYGLLSKEVIDSNTRFTFQLIWETQSVLDIQDYKRVLSKIFSEISSSEKELVKMFLESKIGKHQNNPRFLNTKDKDDRKRKIAKRLLYDIWESEGNEEDPELSGKNK